jgi:hypothetical protein
MAKATKKTMLLLAELNALSIEAPVNIVDIFVTVSGHVKLVTIRIIHNCSEKMYLSGKQPKPVTNVVFSVFDESAEELIGAAIDTANQLIGEVEIQVKDAA